MILEMGEDAVNRYVEHSRTVHLSLMLVCFALVVASFLDADAVLGKALRQLCEIQEVRKKWEPNWAPAEIQKQSEYSFGSGHPEWWITMPRNGGVLGMWHLGVLEWVADYGQKQPDNEPFGHFPGDVPQDGQPLGPYVERMALERPEVSEFKDLEEFERIWNGWQKVTVHQFLIPLAQTVEVEEINEQSIGGFKTQYTINRVPLHCCTVPQGVTRWCVALPGTRSPSGSLELQCIWRDPQGFGAPKKDRSILVHISIELEDHRIELQPGAARKYGVTWSPGPFSQTFPELSAATANLRDLRLDRLAAVLQDLQRHRPESVQLFGTNVPVQQIGRWGSLVVLAVQLYFLLHLCNLVRITAASSGSLLDVPWICIYDGPAAKWASALTTLALPIATNLRFVWLSLSEPDRLDLYLAISASLVSIIIASITGKNLRKLWAAVRLAKPAVVLSGEPRLD